MKYALTFFLVILILSGTIAQNRALNTMYSNGLTNLSTESSFHKTWWPHYFSGDRQQTFRPKSPMLMMTASTSSIKGGSYWMGTMTTQSYNQGKLGTYYFWDVQGNLRESRMFLDIAGKNKRGLKLVFRRH